MFRNRSVSSHDFAMVPRAEIPRSSFQMDKTYKTTLDAGYLVPVFCEEILPGDTINCKMTAFCRLATPIFPIMDNLWIESFFFFVPNRLVWDNWERFMGARDNPSSSTSYVVPQVVSPAGGFAVGSLQDYLGLPTVGQVLGGNTVSVNALPMRGYNLIYNDWFKDQNIFNNRSVPLGDGPDTLSDYVTLQRGKRHDYFTSCLPFTQKGNPVTLPLGSTAPVTVSNASNIDDKILYRRPISGNTTYDATLGVNTSAASPQGAWATWPGGASSNAGQQLNTRIAAGQLTLTGTADLSAATASTINAIRTAFQIQKLLERDARGGTRYTEIIRAHFGVVSPDARLNRTEYLGGGKTPININPIAQTSGTGASGTTTPNGSLAAMGTALARNHGFSQSFTEHGFVIGMVHVGADLTYQQGLRRMWSRSTRYDYYFPVFAALGEQSVLNKEIYCDGSASDNDTFGYQERWAEYRYNPSQITGLFRSTSAGTIDPWHLSQRFSTRPTLNFNFMVDAPPLSRVLAVGAAANGQQLLFDGFFDIKAARPMPMYSVPGLVDHF